MSGQRVYSPDPQIARLQREAEQRSADPGEPAPSMECLACGDVGPFVRTALRRHWYEVKHTPGCRVGAVLDGACAPRDEFEYLANGVAGRFEPGDWDSDRDAPRRKRKRAAGLAADGWQAVTQ